MRARTRSHISYMPLAISQRGGVTFCRGGDAAVSRLSEKAWRLLSFGIISGNQGDCFWAYPCNFTPCRLCWNEIVNLGSKHELTSLLSFVFYDLILAITLPLVVWGAVFFFPTQQHLTASVVNIFIFNHSFVLNCVGAVLQFGHLACWQVQGSGVLRCFTQKKKILQYLFIFGCLFTGALTPKGPFGTI